MVSPAVKPNPKSEGYVITDWRPEDAAFWEEKGKRIATRNLWISIPALLLAFAVWMVWSVAVVNLPNIGFKFDENQLFWLAALPGLSGATLRVFYSFMVPIFGGRRWTAISTASLLIPALWMGFAVQDSQVHSHEGSKLKSAYCFAKHGLIGLSKVLAKEGAEFGVHSYVVCPGFVRTPLVEKQIPEQAKALGMSEADVIKNVMLKETVDGQFTTVDDVANMIVYLSQDTGALTGQSFNVSHGWCMK